ncbi:hypothetical protein LN42_00570 [Marinitoga sp. 1137]|uniref:hypothetical protein n=1 Tax=Marinitoga sp. 1137 TaxID=1545835 RepID=UPI0009503828|nr:hypothetical protein [Marinitoga sp. 1137]APT75054.1 hypothetical protein LN42_00570 [Marinitoga sp. 1137]
MAKTKIVKVKVLNAFFHGKRFEKGDIANLPENVVKALGKRYVEVIEGENNADKSNGTEDVSKN